MPLTLIEKAGVNPYSDVLTEADFRKHFGVIRHPFTNMDYILYYGDIIREYGKECEIIFANHPQDILKYTDAVLACDIHTRQHTNKVLNNSGARIVFGLDDILNHSVNGSGYNE
ncbi:MAG: hypothetical protein KBT27_14735 [Prevotellaceae bacterium]|nr:hypothetical protein [Candidatus Faecinaster equi]